MTDLQDHASAAAANADRAAFAARGLHQALISRNRAQPQGFDDPAAARLRGNQNEAWRLPDQAVLVWVERPAIRDDAPAIAVAIDPSWASMVCFWPPPAEWAGHEVKLRPWRNEAA